MKVIIMRGLPGSGKSTLARKIEERAHKAGKSATIFSTDDYFMGRDGEYNFDPFLLSKAHAHTQDLAEKAMELGTEVVIIDNTNTQAWEMTPYVKAAVANGYSVEFVTPDTEWAFNVQECTNRTTHDVPFESIRRMKGRFEANVTVAQALEAKPPWMK